MKNFIDLKKHHSSWTMKIFVNFIWSRWSFVDRDVNSAIEYDPFQNLIALLQDIDKKVMKTWQAPVSVCFNLCVSSAFFFLCLSVACII